MRGFPAARVWASLEGQRALFDRAVVWLVDNRGLLPGITTLTRLVAEVRAQGAPPRAGPPDEAVPEELRQAMRDLLKVPEGRRVSELERLRTGPMRVSWWSPAVTAVLTPGVGAAARCGPLDGRHPEGTTPHARHPGRLRRGWASIRSATGLHPVLDIRRTARSGCVCRPARGPARPSLASARRPRP
ncbi:DUF4158 domain-containing protein [Streptomyces sp. NPDC060020]|uniref:DUF4158 domain-containing protein n=1 Tax=Streptomyces sp. NPDC060020 TaxID=3347038 RepID=UPI00368BFE90